MRTFAFTFATMLACTATANEPLQTPVTVVLGPKAYRDGDVVQISNVTATSALLEQGDKVTVKGRVRLDSAADAKLCLYLTQTKGDGVEETDSTQEVRVERGRSDFELSITIKHQGVLHLTLYRTNDGKPFGGVYFGTAEQMESITKASVRHYLDE